VYLNVTQLARMIDLSAVRADVELAEVKRLADVCRQYQCACAFVMPCYMAELKMCLSDAPQVGLGGVVGFPSGAQSTAIKVAESRSHLEMGATEIDMVINVGMLKSGNDGYVEDDIRAVIDAAAGIPVKTILEAHHLSESEIVRASEIAVQAGAAFVKTGTGWAPTGATLDNVRLIKQTVGDRAQLKAAGGVRDLATVEAMHRLGVTRFGLGLTSGVAILEACAALSREAKT
jgi:deoxyribose-phosphate aldolase